MDAKDALIALGNIISPIAAGPRGRDDYWRRLSGGIDQLYPKSMPSGCDWRAVSDMLNARMRSVFGQWPVESEGDALTAYKRASVIYLFSLMMRRQGQVKILVPHDDLTLLTAMDQIAASKEAMPDEMVLVALAADGVAVSEIHRDLPATHATIAVGCSLAALDAHWRGTGAPAAGVVLGSLDEETSQHAEPWRSAHAVQLDVELGASISRAWYWSGVSA